MTPRTKETLTGPLDQLAALRRNPLFSHKIALDSCVGSILSVVGPEALFARLDVKIMGNPQIDGDIPLQWIFPILESKMDKNVSVGIFFRQLANMADKMYTEASKLDKLQSAVYFALYREIWALFPQFCQNLVDPATDFLRPAYAKGLNSILESTSEQHRDIKQHVISGLRKLAIFSLLEGKDEYKKVMAKFAPNYLKTLLHMYRAKELAANVMSAAKV